MTRAIMTIKDLSADYLMNRFGKRAIKQTLPINGESYTAILVKPHSSRVAKEGFMPQPDTYIFNESDEFVSRVASRTSQGEQKEIITEATDYGYKTTINNLEPDAEIAKEIHKIELTNLGEFRGIGLFKKVIETLKGFSFDSKSPVKVRTTTYVGSDNGVNSFFSVTGKGENSKFLIDTSADTLSIKASGIDKHNEQVDFNFHSTNPNEIKNYKDYLELALKALKIFD